MNPGKKSRTLLVGIIVAVVAMAAVFGAYVLLMNDGGTAEGTDQNNGPGDDQSGDNGTNNLLPFQLRNGDFIVYTTTTSSGGLDTMATMRWEVSNVTSAGYDVEITFTSDAGTMKYMLHADNNDTLGASGDDADYDQSIKIGAETLSTPFGNKKVDHWQDTNTTDMGTSVTDYYVGAQTPVMYKLVTTTTGSEDGIFDGVSTMVLSDTNIDAIRNGNV